MPQTIHVYCDESCHLQYDKQSCMVLGAVWCPLDKVKEIGERICDIKIRHGLSPTSELKWTKASTARIDAYLEAIDYFFDQSDLHFRGVVAPKTTLDHSRFGQTHDDWYYKMYFYLLRAILSPKQRYRIFIDIKDTRGRKKVAKLHDVLCNNLYDFSREIVDSVQIIRSHEAWIMQLADVLIGAISYVNRNAGGSTSKHQLVERIRRRSGYAVTRSTLPSESKFNLFHWIPSNNSADQ